jgi:hypothetical protein
MNLIYYQTPKRIRQLLKCSPFLGSLLIVFFLLGSSNLFAFQIGGGIGGGSGDGRGCDSWTVELCIVDECGDPLLLPYERLSQLDVVINNSTNVSTSVSLQDENGCVTLTYNPPFGFTVQNIRILWSFQQNGCPETHLDCTPEEFTFGIDHELILGPNCNEFGTMTLSNYTRRNQFYLRTDDCERKVLNRINHTEEICGNDPTLFFEVSDAFIGNYAGNNYAEEFEIIDNNNLDDAGNPTVVASEFVRCPEGRLQALLLFTTKDFVCGVDEEGNPIIERVGGIDLTNYLGLSADPTCEEPSNITLNINLYCCSEDGPSDEPFVNLSYTFIWQPDVTIPDPLFYFSTGNLTEAMNNGTVYDNGNQTDNLLINFDNTPTQFTGNGPILGRVSLGLTFVEEIVNSACLEKFTVEFFEFTQCDLVDWAAGDPMTYDHDNDPETPEISEMDVTGEVTEDGYTVSLFDLPTDPNGNPVITFDISSCYYVKVKMHNKCGDVIEEYGRFNTASCNFCRLVQEEAPPLEATVYPSVVRDRINIQLSRSSNSETEVSIYDVSGRPIGQRVFDANNTQLQINSLNVSSGMYFIQIKSGDFEKVSKIFIQK